MFIARTNIRAIKLTLHGIGAQLENFTWGGWNCSIDILTIVHIEYKIINFDILYIFLNINEHTKIIQFIIDKYQKKKKKKNPIKEQLME